MKRIISLAVLSTIASVVAAEELSYGVEVSNVSMRQMSDRHRTVEVSYNLTSSDGVSPAWVRLDILTNGVSIGMENIKNVTGDWTTNAASAVSPGMHMLRWAAKKDWPGHFATNVDAVIRAYTTNQLHQIPGVYMVVDVSGGQSAQRYPVSYTLCPPLNSNENLGDKIWLRRIEACPEGFLMGSPDDEEGRSAYAGNAANINERLHKVMLTEPFFAGVFPITYQQYVNVIAKATGDLSGGIYSPIDYVSYRDIRGATTEGSVTVNWPTTLHQVGTGSFLAAIRSRTGITFDLPTEAQWEYACRAGTTTAWNNGTGISTNAVGVDANLDLLGWYKGNSNDSLPRVGLKNPNAWGLYDCHGSVGEFCLDWIQGGYSADDQTDPQGPISAWTNWRAYRSGSFRMDAYRSRSAYRGWGQTETSRTRGIGFRLFAIIE